jgi:hypothetical protein
MHNWGKFGDSETQTKARTYFWRRCIHRHLRRRHLSTKTECMNQPLDGGAVPNEGTVALICKRSTASSRLSLSIFCHKIITQTLRRDTFEVKLLTSVSHIKMFDIFFSYTLNPKPPQYQSNHLLYLRESEHSNDETIRRWLKECMWSWNCITEFVHILLQIYWEYLTHAWCFEITTRHTTVGRTPLDKRSTRPRDLYLVTDTTTTSN